LPKGNGSLCAAMSAAYDDHIFNQLIHLCFWVS
jgi:hypothetical protein